ncbi:two-component system response regulator [Geovibrio thiophilus]|uniref:Two-component system response regulator n=1 Tax=Geovibrio thiophilus TaxID=139438 RepID=A0A410JZC5_9BACT|nr:two-component system response regulator [Geovibrio thiophilus]QAR33401.1 two-component system response regulator [Geovibrio thiophilus]
MENRDRRQTVLVVDDVPENIDILSNILKPEFKVKVAINGRKAIEIAEKDMPDIILLDVMMPEISGYEVCRALKSSLVTRSIPVIFITAKGDVEDESMGFSAGGVDYITKPVSAPIVLARVKTQLAMYDHRRMLETMVRERTKELHETRLEIIRRLGFAAEYKDNETGMHVIRMSRYCHLIAKKIGMKEAEAELILSASPMHDVGKIGIPDSILLKPGKLDDDEWQLMKEHPRIGYRIIGGHDSELLQTAATAALTHHEKWDGSGYPEGLKGENIPVIGRITAVADVFDALTSERPYKSAWSIEKAAEYIRNESGRHFEPRLAEAFLKCLPDVIKIRDNFGD